MTGPERGFLLLTSHLGLPGRTPLTTAQMRKLGQTVRSSPFLEREQRDLTAWDLMKIGYSQEEAVRIERLLSEEEKLDRYLALGERWGCRPLTWVTPGYPRELLERLKLESPGVLWYKGDLSALQMPMIALVGSRDLYTENRNFAVAVGKFAAELGCVLVSGNARGADTEAQESCLAHGGRVISVVAKELWKEPDRKNVLYLAEDGFD